jgi:hypothetical protein
MALPWNSLPVEAESILRWKQFFHRQKRGREGDNGNSIQNLATAKKIGFQSRYLLQNRSKEHEQLFKVREKLRFK